MNHHMNHTLLFRFDVLSNPPILGRNSSFATEAPCLLWFHRGGTWWRWRWAPSRCCPPGGYAESNGIQRCEQTNRGTLRMAATRGSFGAAMDMKNCEDIFGDMLYISLSERKTPYDGGVWKCASAISCAPFDIL